MIHALKHGEIQEGDMERKAKTDHVLGEIVENINENLIDKNSGTYVSHEMIRNLLRQVNFKVLSSKSVKASTLHAINILVNKFENLQRTYMKIKIEFNIIFEKQKENNTNDKYLETYKLFSDKLNEIINEHYYTNIYVVDHKKDDMGKILDILNQPNAKFTFIVSPFITKLFDNLKNECNKMLFDSVS